jgi:hypothetical protein
MKFLFDSRGSHIANEVNWQLHAPTGQNIGHYLATQKFYIDMDGYYLGEIVFENRLLYRLNNPYKSVCFGRFGNYGNVGNYGNPGNYGSIGTIAGFSDLDKAKLKPI